MTPREDFWRANIYSLDGRPDRRVTTGAATESFADANGKYAGAGA